MSKEIEPATPLPCPFCGDDEIWSFPTDDKLTAGYVVQCQRCGATCGPPKPTHNAAREIWNTRTPDPKLKTREKQLIEALETCLRQNRQGKHYAAELTANTALASIEGEQS